MAADSCTHIVMLIQLVLVKRCGGVVSYFHIRGEDLFCSGKKENHWWRFFKSRTEKVFIEWFVGRGDYIHPRKTTLDLVFLNWSLQESPDMKFGKTSGGSKK